MLAGILTAYMYFYGQPKDLSNVDAVKERISQHYVLPSNEQPALVTITDNSKLTSEFLKQSKKLLVHVINLRIK